MHHRLLPHPKIYAQRGFAGTPWEAGDRIITTNYEHPALVGPINWARDYRGVEVRIVDLPSNFSANITVDDVLELFENELKRRLGNDPHRLP